MSSEPSTLARRSLGYAAQVALCLASVALLVVIWLPIEGFRDWLSTRLGRSAAPAAIAPTTTEAP